MLQGVIAGLPLWHGSQPLPDTQLIAIKKVYEEHDDPGRNIP